MLFLHKNDVGKYAHKKKWKLHVLSQLKVGPEYRHLLIIWLRLLVHLNYINKQHLPRFSDKTIIPVKHVDNIYHMFSLIMILLLNIPNWKLIVEYLHRRIYINAHSLDYTLYYWTVPHWIICIYSRIPRLPGSRNPLQE